MSTAPEMLLAPPDHAAAMPWASVEVGPALPMQVHTCAETWKPDRIGAMAVYCSDGRWGEAFDEFCHKRLLIPRYDRWAVPGGPAWLARATQTQFEFLVRVHELERIVLITHFGCAFYRDLLQQPAEGCLPAQMNDLRTVAKTLHEWHPNMQVEACVAMQKGSCLSFHQMEL
jgi:hypothetical protein